MKTPVHGSVNAPPGVTLTPWPPFCGAGALDWAQPATRLANRQRQHRNTGTDQLHLAQAKHHLSKLCKIQHTDVGSAWLRPITPSSLGPAQHLRRGSSRKTRRAIPVTLPVYITRNTASRLFHALRVVPPTRERLVHYLLHDSPVNGDGSYREEQLIPKPTAGGFCRSWTL